MKPWLFKIATNVALNGFKKAKRLPVVSIDHVGSCSDGNCSPFECADETAADPAETAHKTEQAELVRKALQELPPRQRATLVLAYYDQLSYAQIADILDCSLGTVKSQMFRALKTLAQKLPDTVGGLL
jgi:RNA polymerase sigma-70 factor (ECF subfamily)